MEVLPLLGGPSFLASMAAGHCTLLGGPPQNRKKKTYLTQCLAEGRTIFW